MPDSEKVIEVKNLTKEFNSFKAVDNISFDVFEGEIVGLLGPNGAGKTTTIQMILDLVTPSAGEIKVFGKKMSEAREEILEKINFSSAYVSLPYNLKVIEVLLTFARLYNVKNPKERIKELTRYFGIEDFLNKMVSFLSSGQLTRLNLCKAMLNAPKLLFLDEPTASLDPDMADRTLEFLKKIQKEMKITMIFTSHNMKEVEELCDRCIFILSGKIVSQGPPKEMVKKYGRKDLNEVFIDLVRKRTEKSEEHKIHEMA